MSVPASAEGLPPVPRRILPAIALSQFAGTSLWFSLNAVLPDLQQRADLPDSALGGLTAAVQIGFIAGTLVFALLAVADRFSPRLVFFACSLVGAALAAATALLQPSMPAFLLAQVLLRFATGFVLAGIYPVGMKIAAGWYAGGLGWALGVLVGALVLGTAAPFGLRAIGAAWPWEQVLWGVAVFAAFGGVVMALLVPDGPYLRRAPRIDPRALAVIWRDARVRASAFGYFGHMWELYAFMVLVPAIVLHRWPELSAAGQSGWVFAAIAAGAPGCVLGGLASRRIGGARVATGLLITGAACGLASPWLLDAPAPLWVAWLLLWGFAVAGDSPQFSALTAQNAPREWVGSVLTFVNSIGFAITVASILLFTTLTQQVGLAAALPWLAVGPLLGVWAMRLLWRSGA
jgi:MFS transporter, DHA1 family, inner membrane transport protein